MGRSGVVNSTILPAGLGWQPINKNNDREKFICCCGAMGAKRYSRCSEKVREDALSEINNFFLLKGPVSQDLPCRRRVIFIALKMPDP